MPTGYTADVMNGKITTLREFALMCARGMGACIMMRDDPWDAPIPERFEPSDYHSKKLIELQDEKTRVEAMTPAEATTEAQAKLAAIQASNGKYAAEKVEQTNRYNAMLALVTPWKGAPEGLKEFMVSQLQEGRRFDCGGEPYQAPLPSSDGEDWRRDALEKIAKDIAHHEGEQAKEVARTNGRNAWLAQLRASLTDPST